MQANNRTYLLRRRRLQNLMRLYRYNDLVCQLCLTAHFQILSGIFHFEFH